MKIRVKGKKVITSFDIDGSAFGCNNPEPEKVTLTKRKGTNRWNSKGLKAKWVTDFGANVLKMKLKSSKNLKVNGSGVSPCTDQITYTYAGSIKKNKVFKANVEIFSNGGKFADSSMSMKKG